MSDEPPAVPPAQPLLASLLECDLLLARANSPRERLEILAELARDLHHESQLLAEAASEEDLTALAKLYVLVLRDGIWKQARSLPPSQRRTVLRPIAERLAQAAHGTDEKMHTVPRSKEPALQTIAEAARDLERRLDALLQEEKS
jgi:hypothetical protein